MEKFKESWYQFFFKGLIEFSRESVRSWTFLFWETIAASISFQVIDLFRWLDPLGSVFHVISMQKCVHFFKIFKFLGIYVLKAFSDDSLDFLGVCFYLPFCVSDFIDLGIFSLFILVRFAGVCQSCLFF
jgi:hypothetical protein